MNDDDDDNDEEEEEKENECCRTIYPSHDYRPSFTLLSPLISNVNNIVMIMYLDKDIS